jgi:pyruvate dehydrogenase E1 component
MPAGCEEGILKGLYRYQAAQGARLPCGCSAAERSCAKRCARSRCWATSFAADVWSATSYNELRREALRVER